MKKMLFIMNPFAGVKRANRHLADILLTFTQAGYEVITHMTLGAGRRHRRRPGEGQRC